LEVRLHAGVCPPHSFKTRRPPPAVDAGHDILETGRKAEEALGHGFGRPQRDAEVLERRSRHAKQLHQLLHSMIQQLRRR
jgi:hypothetical protein